MSQPELDWTVPKDDFMLEMLEVVINTIIYIRNVYPESIFKRQKMYNTTCYMCIYPPLKDYIQNVLITATALKRQNELQKIDLIFEKDETTLLEIFSFGFESAPGSKALFDDQSNDQYLIETEETIRGILLSLDEKCKNLKKLPESGVNFKIFLHTTQQALVKLTSDPKVQDFPWTQGKDVTVESNTILPMVQVAGFQLNAEEFT
ncbi:DNA polymerase zeta subunit 2 [Pseudolycoriella hygida]|uniref:DNA polymerase zeta subunit 2 n=1 Tax=Pseudolycoriella hygida TaxID=35572 RepID=A0A9Q0RWV2_9DIPT|nr:DNA polymerase zeta subunit 2 [Pseudolycoriella hygida]